MNNQSTPTTTPTAAAVIAALYGAIRPTGDEMKAVYSLPTVELCTEGDLEGTASYFWFAKYHGNKPDGYPAGVQVWLYSQKDGTYIVHSHNEPDHVESPTFGEEAAFYIAHRIATDRAARLLAQLQSESVQKRNRRAFEYYLADWITREVERLIEEGAEPDTITIDADMYREAIEAYESVNEAHLYLTPNEHNEGVNGLIKMDIDQ